MRQGALASAVVVFQVANTLLALAISQVVFAESLSPQRWAGIAVAIAGVILVELGQADVDLPGVTTVHRPVASTDAPNGLSP